MRLGAQLGLKEREFKGFRFGFRRVEEGESGVQIEECIFFWLANSSTRYQSLEVLDLETVEGGGER